MNYHTAFDVSLRSVSICIVYDDGVIQFEAQVPAEVEEIVACLRRFSLEVGSVGFEAGALTQYLAYGLHATGYEVICLEARQVSAALAAMRNKIDKNNARGIAQILRAGWYSRVHVKSLESHLVRALLSSRKTILKKCVDIENEIRGLIRLLGIRLPGTLKHGAYDAVLRQAIEADGSMVNSLIPLLDVRLMLYQTYLKLDNQFKALVREDPVCQRLMTVPGVGAITALTFKAAADDPGRISKAGDPDV